MDVLRTSHMRLQQRCHDAEAHVERLLVENQRLREALEQFANPQHWGMTHDYSRERVPVWIGTYRLAPTEFARTALDGRDA
jgi:hypothetical protein